ncbi:MAG: HEAT repeat domain-containing protein [Planctomycetaceae bacterium]|nr:HEAT repeat domain-containing protein [Planctomycetaceae bacterium]
MTFSHSSPGDFRSWIDGRHESDELKQSARDAVDDYESALAACNAADSVDRLYDAAIHFRSIVWEVALPLLSQLAGSSDLARQCIQRMSTERNSELRRRSIQYLDDFYPRSFCIQLLHALLQDRSAKVRGFAASRIEGLGLVELLPNLKTALHSEKNKVARFELDYALCLLRDGYYEMHRSGYCLAIRNADSGPGGAVWIRNFRGKPLSAERVRELGIEVVCREVLDNHGVKPLRPWQWKDE